MGQVRPESMTESMHNRNETDMPKLVGNTKLILANMASVRMI